MAISPLGISARIITSPYPALYATVARPGLTVMSWVNVADYSITDSRIVNHSSAGLGTTDNFIFSARSTNQHFKFNARRWGTTEGLFDFASPTSLTWTHVALTYDYSSTANVPLAYLNGKATSVSVITTPAGTVSAPTALTTLFNSGGNGTNVWHGFLAHQAYWNRILNEAEILEVKKHGPLAVPAGLLWYLPLDPVRQYVGANLAPGYEAIGRGWTPTSIINVGYDPYDGQYVGSPSRRRQFYNMKREASALSITTQPSGAVDGTAFTGQPVIQLRDAQGATVSESGRTVTAALATGSGTLGGTLTAVSNSSGVATFANLKITGAGTGFSVIFTEPGCSSITSSTFTVAAASVTATELRVTTQPANTVVGQTMASIIVKATDAAGVTSIAYVTNVVLTYQTNPGTAPTPGGTLTRAAVAGVATFNDVVISMLQTGAQFHFTSGALTAANSSTFNITVPAAGGGSLFGGGLVHRRN